METLTFNEIIAKLGRHATRIDHPHAGSKCFTYNSLPIYVEYAWGCEPDVMHMFAGKLYNITLTGKYLILASYTGFMVPSGQIYYGMHFSQGPLETLDLYYVTNISLDGI